MNEEELWVVVRAVEAGLFRWCRSAVDVHTQLESLLMRRETANVSFVGHLFRWRGQTFWTGGGERTGGQWTVKGGQ